MERCPIDSMRQELFDQGFLTEQQDSAIRADIEESLEQALQAARQSPLPGPQEVFTHVYFEGR
jgi:TPP-dependent pyruvate/acetoin dehydrogenase alpha subunit